MAGDIFVGDLEAAVQSIHSLQGQLLAQLEASRTRQEAFERTLQQLSRDQSRQLQTGSSYYNCCTPRLMISVCALANSFK